MAPKRILLIAGSDSSGGAGLEADQKVLAAHGCYAMTATTALTAQNTQGVHGVYEIPAPFVRKQIDACIDDIGVDVVKIGMLASTAIVETVAEALEHHHVPEVVLDPVMVATTGARLLPQNAVLTICKRLLPLATVVTPNIPEAEVLLDEATVSHEEIQDVEGMVQVAKAVHSLGPKYVLLKGGHLPFDRDHRVARADTQKNLVVNVLVGDGKTVILESQYLNSKNTHGTGCSLASAIAANLASGMVPDAAVKLAAHYVDAGIRTSVQIGHGSGPINHFHPLSIRPFSSNHFIEYLLSASKVKDHWRAFVEHDFVQLLASGELPVANFKNYLIQDYLFLIQFARANALAAYKTQSLEEISASVQAVEHLIKETKLHVDYCKGFGLSEADLLSQEESQACTAYTRYVLDIGQSQDWFALKIAVLPCIMGYGLIARRLFDDPNTKREGNRYWDWIETYAAPEYEEAMAITTDLIEKHAVSQSTKRIEELTDIFIHATKLETGFWAMGLENWS